MFVTTLEADRQRRLTADSMRAIRRRVAAFVKGDGNVKGWEITRDFGTVVVTSDVHADLRKMVQLMVNARLVRIADETGDIYSDVWNIEWIAGDTLLVILGDLVDGKRRKDVTDPRGSYELLIHILIFNLRISARAVDGDVLFTIGNHDLFSVLLPARVPTWPKYTVNTHLAFPPHREHATQWEQRAAMLELFYLCSPYLLIRLGSVLLMHGGMLGSAPRAPGVDGACIFDATKGAQRAIHAAMEAERSKHRLMGVKDALELYLRRTNRRCGSNVTEARGYAELSKKQICAAEETSGLAADGVQLVVAGHCITQKTRHVDRDECKTNLAGDSDVGCVAYFTCEGGPTIMLVDVALSEGFRLRESDSDANASRPVEILKMKMRRVGEGEMRPQTGDMDDTYVQGAAKETWYKLLVVRPKPKTNETRKRSWFDEHV